MRVVPEVLRVMTFNVRGSRRGDGVNAWRNRSRLNVEVIRDAGPHLIGFQELQRGNLDVYRRRLPGYECVLGTGYENHRPYAFNAIFYDPRMLDPLERGGFWLSETPQRRSRSWGSSHVRSANWVRFCLPDGSEFVHLNTHLDHRSGNARLKGAELIVGKLGEIAGEDPVLLTGDFNCNPGSKTYRVFIAAGFTDAHRAAGNPTQNTFHRFRGEDFVPKRPEAEGRLDWILMRGGWTLHSCHVIRHSDPPLYPSDHYPVLTRISLRWAERHTPC